MRGDKWILWIDMHRKHFHHFKRHFEFFCWLTVDYFSTNFVVVVVPRTLQTFLLMNINWKRKHINSTRKVCRYRARYTSLQMAWFSRLHGMRFFFLCLFGIQKNLKWPKIALQWFSQANYFAGENGALWIFHDYTGTWSINNVFMWCEVVEMMCMKRSIEEIKGLFCTVNWLGWKLFIASDTGSVVIYSKSIEVRINVENNSCQCANECNVTSHHEMFATSIYAP